MKLLNKIPRSCTFCCRSRSVHHAGLFYAAVDGKLLVVMMLMCGSEWKRGFLWRRADKRSVTSATVYHRHITAAYRWDEMTAGSRCEQLQWQGFDNLIDSIEHQTMDACILACSYYTDVHDDQTGRRSMSDVTMKQTRTWPGVRACVC